MLKTLLEEYIWCSLIYHYKLYKFEYNSTNTSRILFKFSIQISYSYSFISFLSCMQNYQDNRETS